MTFRTTKSKSFYCSHIDMNVTLTGSYRISEHENEAHFLYADCSIVENSKLPIYEQSESIKYLRCPLDKPCDLSAHFDDVINLKD